MYQQMEVGLWRFESGSATGRALFSFVFTRDKTVCIPARAANPNGTLQSDLLYFPRWFCWPQRDCVTRWIFRFEGLYLRRCFSNVLKAYGCVVKFLHASMTLLTVRILKIIQQPFSIQRPWSGDFNPEYAYRNPAVILKYSIIREAGYRTSTFTRIFSYIQRVADTRQNPPMTDKEAGSEIVMRL